MSVGRESPRMSTHQFTVPVSDLDAGGKSARFTVPAAWVRGALEGHEATASGADGAIEVRLSKSGPDVVARGTFDTEVSLPCARCLEPFKLPIHADLSVLYVPAGKLKSPDADDYEFSADEADTLPYDGDEVALDDLVRDELLLEIPMIPLCSEACPGMSSAPGEQGSGKDEAAAHVDPRLLPLMQFRAKPTKT